MADFGSMSNEEREAHYLTVCKSLGIDPKLRLLDYIWMNNEQGGPRSMVLYARRGAAEVFRAERGISVTKTTKEDGDGYVSFIVEGTDKKGRTEIAVGVGATKGLTGERLAYSVMTAHTRATRRLTLQFVGQGLLDESEVNGQTTDISQSPASLAQLSGTPAVMPPPQVAPAEAPGRDITPKIETTLVPTMDQMRAEATRQLNEKTLKQSLPKIQPDKKADIVDPLDTPTLAPASVTTETVPADLPAKKRAPRKKKGVDISSPGQVSAVAETPQISEKSASADIPESQRTTTPVPEVGTIVPEKGTDQSLEKQALQPKPDPKPVNEGLKLSPEKQEEYRRRFGIYSTDILLKGNMQAAESMGKTTKLRKFASIYTGSPIEKMDEGQWEKFMTFMDDYTAKHGPVGIVSYIDKALGF